MIDRKKNESVLIILIFHRASNPQTSTAAGLISSTNISIEKVLSVIFFVKVICCLFNQSTLRFFDRDHRSVIAPPVFSP